MWRRASNCSPLLIYQPREDERLSWPGWLTYSGCWAQSWSRCTSSQPTGDLLKSSPGGRLPLLSTRPVVTFPAKECHRPLTSTKLYCLVTEAHRCEQLAQGCYAALPWWESNSWPSDCKTNALPLRNCANFNNNTYKNNNVSHKCHWILVSL